MGLDEHSHELHRALARVVTGGEDGGRRGGRVVHLGGVAQTPLRRRSALAVLEHVHLERVEDRDEAVEERPHLEPLLGREVMQHELLDRGALGLEKVDVKTLGTWNLYSSLGTSYRHISHIIILGLD